MNKQIELNREYWGRVINMCQGTALEGREWGCVKYRGSHWGSYHHPIFCEDDAEYELAVAVVEDKAVFKDSEIYHKNTGVIFNWSLEVDWGVVNWSAFTWQRPKPPKPPRTFLLNGVELPCPVKKHEGNWYIQINGSTYWFKLEGEANKVQNTISDILDLARDKE